MYNEVKETQKEILPGIGLEDIRFGMQSNEVYSILGCPNEIEIYCYPGLPNDKSEKWYYKKDELSISFHEEDEWKLNTISINSDNCHFKNLIYGNQDLKSVKSILVELGFENFEFEDWSNIESPDHKLISIDQLEMNFWFDHEKLSEIQWGPLFSDNETIVWPISNQNDQKINILNPKSHDSQYLFDKLQKYLNDWLDRIFDQNNNQDYLYLLKEFPIGLTREDLTIESSSLNYFID